MQKAAIRFKCLISICLLVNQFGFAQLVLVEDSWSNAGKWWKAETYNQNDLWYWGIGLAGAGLVFSFDSELQKELSFTNPNQSEELSPFMEPFGNVYYTGSMALMIYASGAIFNSEEARMLGSTSLQSIATASVGAVFLKMVFHRQRPEEQLALDAYRFGGPSFSTDNLSFPSAHTAIAFSLASSISTLYENKLYIAIPLYSLAGLTAWQRIYAQKHWPSDVLVGGLLGYFVGKKIAQWQKDKQGRISIKPGIGQDGSTLLGIGLKLDPISSGSRTPLSKSLLN